MSEIADQIKMVIESIYKKKHEYSPVISDTTSLRSELGFDSFDLAELTVKIEDIFNVDVFENRIVDTLEEIREEIENGKK